MSSTGSQQNRGYPVMLRMDNGPEFISRALAEWAEKHTVQLEFIQPGKRHRTHSLNALTEHIAQKYSIFICSER